MPKTSESSQILLSSKPLRTMRINIWHFQCNVYFKKHHRRRHHRGRHHRRRHDRLLHDRNRVRHGDVAIHHHLARHRTRDRNRHLHQRSEKVALLNRSAEPLWQEGGRKTASNLDQVFKIDTMRYQLVRKSGLAQDPVAEMLIFTSSRLRRLNNFGEKRLLTKSEQHFIKRPRSPPLPHQDTPRRGTDQSYGTGRGICWICST